MTSRPERAPWWAALAVAAALAAAPAAAQQGDQPAAAGDEQPQVEAEPGFETGEESSEMDAIDEILEGEIEVLGGAAHSYDPGDRRDPFRSLLVTGDPRTERGPRPEGVPGLLIDELRLSGIYRTAQGWVAQVQAAANEKGYLIKEGDQLYDGDVVSVTRDEVIFRQIVRDPAALKPFQEVTKRLNP
jgi:hypothetical protein